jgi:hypothetical protein
VPKRFEDPIRVPIAVLDGLETVRESEETDMLNHRAVQAVADRLGYPETALWIKDHPREYEEGIFRGFVAIREE